MYRYRKIAKLGLKEEYDKGTEIGKWLNHTFGLSFLDPSEVGDSFVEDFISDIPNDSRVVEYADYLTETYIEENALFSPDLWAAKTSSMYLTTNVCESFHAHFNDNFYHSHPNINVFVSVILQIQIETYIKIKSVPVGPQLNSKMIKVKSFVDDVIKQYNCGEISRKDFVKKLCYRYKI